MNDKSIPLTVFNEGRLVAAVFSAVTALDHVVKANTCDAFENRVCHLCAYYMVDIELGAIFVAAWDVSALDELRTCRKVDIEGGHGGKEGEGKGEGHCWGVWCCSIGQT